MAQNIKTADQKTATNAKILIKNTGWLYFSRIITQLISFFVSVLVIRNLAIDVFGTYNILNSTLGIIAIFSVDPIIDVFFRYLPEIYSERKRNKIQKLITLGFILSILFLTIVLLVVYYYNQQLTKFLNIESISLYFGVFCSFVVLISLERLIYSALTSLLLHKKAGIIDIMKSAVRSFLYLYYLSNLNIKIILLIESGIALFYILFAGVVFIRQLNLNLKVEHESKSEEKSTISRKRILKYGLLSAFNGLGVGLVSRTSDYYIISSIGNPQYVGLYSFAYQLYALIFKVIPLTEFYSVLRPLFFKKYSKDHNNDFTDIYNFIIKAMLPLYLLPALYFITFGKEIIAYIYGSKYSSAYIVTCIVLSGGVTATLFYPLSLIIMLKERVEISLYSKVVVVFSIIGGILAMKYSGIEAVAMVTLLGDMLKNIFMYIYLKKYVKMSYKFVEYKNYLFLSAVLIIVFTFLRGLITDVISLSVISLMFFCASGLLLIKVHVFNPDELTLLKSISGETAITRNVARVIKFISNIKLGVKCIL